MRIILDTNEYIFGLDTETAEEAAPGRVLDAIRILIEEYEDFRLLLPEIIRKEVQRNIPADLEGDFYRLIYSSEKIENHSMPLLSLKRLIISFQKIDIFIETWMSESLSRSMQRNFLRY